MKRILTFFAVILALSATAQKVQPIQIQTVNDSVYVVEYVPLSVAQKGVAAQLVQVDKQLSTVEKQMAELIKKRDELLKQEAALKFAQQQLANAAVPPPPPPVKTTPTPPTPAKKKAKKQKN